MAKNKDMETTKLQSGRVVEYHKDFFLNTLVVAIEKSEGVFSCPAHKVLAAGTLKMLFYKFNLADFMNDVELTVEDYKQFFEKSAIEVGVADYIYYKLFGEIQDEK